MVPGIIRSVRGIGRRLQSRVMPLLITLIFMAPLPAAAVDAHRTPTSTGVVIPNKSVVLAAKIIGRVAAVNADEADKVERGDVLVDIADAELRAELAAAEARLKREELNQTHMKKLAARVERLHAQNAASAENLDDANFRLAAAREQVATARADVVRSRAMLDETKISAPFSGIVISKGVEVGDVTAPGEPLLKLEDHSVLKFRTSVNERDVPLIETGQPVTVTIDALDDLELVAKVSKIVPSGDEATHEFVVEALLPPADKLFPGMFGKATFGGPR
jgi:RND family efflux transporter MFP subunit